MERELRADGQAARGEARGAGIGETTVAHFIATYGERTEQVAGLASASRERRGTALKAVITTWPDLPSRDVRRVTANECRTWAAKALREGTGSVAPRAKIHRVGMSASAFNKAVDALRSVFEIAREQGVIYRNPAAEITKAPMKRKRLSLPSPEQFQAIVKHIAESGSKWSEDCADLVRLLAYSGMRLREGPHCAGVTWTRQKSRSRRPGPRQIQAIGLFRYFRHLAPFSRKSANVAGKSRPVTQSRESADAVEHSKQHARQWAWKG